jgi:predicted AAA+ superfamily ATPase
MENLFSYQEALLKEVPVKERYLKDKINWNSRLIAIKGARGSGKTTVLLQRIKFQLLKEGAEYLYTTLDDLYFLENTLVDLAKEFVQLGGTHLFLDEVHKYPRWSRELKLIYDQHPKLKIVFTSSSMLELYKGESDLSRRVITYHLKEFSLREYIYFTTGRNTRSISFKDILENHKAVARELMIELQVPPLKYFKEYLSYGAYPYYLEDRETYKQRLIQTITLIIETDMNAVENITYNDSRKIKKLLVAIAESAPFVPNISKLSERLGINRTFLLNAIKLLERADLIMSFYTSAKGIGALTKPEKLFLHNTNITYALGKNNVQIGALRETFFANQVKGLHQVFLAKKADFLVDEKYVFEVGGKGKTNKQIKGLKNAYIVKDDIEVGALNIIPLWLFGFLY